MTRTPLSDYIRAMNIETLRDRLIDCNLSEVARLTGMSVRTIRRIKNGYTSDMRIETMDKIVRVLRRAKA